MGRRLTIPLICIIIVAGLTACGRGGVPVPQGSDTAAPWLPPPGELRAVSVASSSVTGAKFVAEWPHARVEPAGSAARFTPDTAAGSGLEPAGYAIYALSAEQLAGLATLRLEFSQLGDGGKAWLGTADYARGCWDWQALPAPYAGRCTLMVRADQHRQGGVMPVALVFLGATPWMLERIELTGPTVNDHPWPMEGGNAQRTCLSPYVGPQTNKLKWKFHTTGFNPSTTLYNQIITDTDGNIYAYGWYLSIIDSKAGLRLQKYFYSRDLILDNAGNLYAVCEGSSHHQIKALDAVGEPKWTCTIPSYVNGFTAGAGGQVYAGCYDTRLYAIANDGSLAWSFDTFGDVGKPCVAPDGSIIFASNNSMLNNYSLFCLEPDGSQRWMHLEGGWKSDPVMSADGTIYAGSGYKLLALDAAGEEKWRFQTKATVQKPMLAANGDIFFISGDSTLYIIDSDGGMLASAELEARFKSMLILPGDDFLYVLSDEGIVNAYDHSGTCSWSYDTGAGEDAMQLASGIGGELYVACGGCIQAIRRDVGLVWQCNSGAPINTGPVLAYDGSVYFGADDDTLYALDPAGNCKWSQQFDEISRIALNRQNRLYVNYWPGSQAKVKPSGIIEQYMNNHISLFCRDGTFYFIKYNEITACGEDCFALWRAQAEESLKGPTRAEDGMVYAIGQTTLYAFSGGSAPLWQYDVALEIAKYPMTAPDGSIYIASQAGSHDDDEIYAITPTGELAWSIKASFTDWALMPDGSLLIADYYNNAITAYSSKGQFRWTHELATRQNNAFAIGADGIIYVGGSSTALLALNPDGSLKWTAVECAEISSGLALGADGTLYAGSSDGYLYAFHD